MPHGAIPFPFGQCRICNDRATGVHYGVATCEGCKGFYKRSLLKAEKYKCFFGGQCSLSPQNRNRCKYCRFQRCINSGMSVDAVKMGRIPKVEKERALDEERQKHNVLGQPLLDEYGRLIPLPAMDRDSADTGSDVTPRRETPPREGDRQDEGPSEQQGSSSSLLKMDASLDMDVKPRLPPFFSDVTASPEKTDKVIDAAFPHTKQTYKALAQNHAVPPNDGAPPNNISTPASRTSMSSESLAVSRTYRFLTDNPPSSSGCHPHQVLPLESPNVPRVPNLSSNLNMSTSNLPPSRNTLRHFTFDNNPDVSRASSSDSGVGEAFVTEDKVSTPESTMKHPTSPVSPDTERKNSAFSPGVIQELINQVLESGQGREIISQVIEGKRGHNSAGNVLGNLESTPSSTPGEGLLGISSGTAQGVLRQDQRGGPAAYLPPNNTGPSSVHRAPLSRTTSVDFDARNAAISALMANQQRSGSRRKFSEGDFCQTSFGSNMPPAKRQGSWNCGIDSGVSSFNKQKSMGSLLPPPSGMPSNKHFAGHMNLPQIPTTPYNVYCQSQSQSQGQSQGHGQGQGHAQARSRPPNTPQQMPPFQHKHLHIHVNSSQTRNHPPMAHQSGSSSSSSLSLPVAHQAHPVEDNTCIDPQDFDQYLQPSIKQEVIEPDSHQHGFPLNSGFPDDGVSSEVLLPDSSQDIKQEEDSLNRDLAADMIKCFHKAREKYLAFIEPRKITLREHLLGIRAAHPLNQLKQSKKAQVQYIWDQIFATIPQINDMILGMCKEIPQFNKLNTDDQSNLMKTSYFDIWFLANTCLFQNGESYLLLPCGAFYTRWWMRHFLPNHLVEAMFNLAEMLNKCHLSDLEITILCAMQLTSPDRKDLSDQDTVRRLNNRYLDVLTNELQETHGSSHRQIFYDICHILPKLDPLNREQAEVIGKFRVDSPPETCYRWTEDEDSEENNRVLDSDSSKHLLKSGGLS